MCKSGDAVDRIELVRLNFELSNPPYLNPTLGALSDFNFKIAALSLGNPCKFLLSCVSWKWKNGLIKSAYDKYSYHNSLGVVERVYAMRDNNNFAKFRVYTSSLWRFLFCPQHVYIILIICQFIGVEVQHIFRYCCSKFRWFRSIAL